MNWALDDYYEISSSLISGQTDDRLSLGLSVRAVLQPLKKWESLIKSCRISILHSVGLVLVQGYSIVFQRKDRRRPQSELPKSSSSASSISCLLVAISPSLSD